MAIRANVQFVEDLEKIVAGGCQVPGCTHEHHDTLFLKGRCHLNSDVKVSYTKNSGEILIVCATCEREITRVAIARRCPNTSGN